MDHDSDIPAGSRSVGIVYVWVGVCNGKGSATLRLGNVTLTALGEVH